MMKTLEKVKRKAQEAGSLLEEQHKDLNEEEQAEVAIQFIINLL